MKVQELTIGSHDRKIIQNLAYATTIMLCPLTKVGKLHVTKATKANVPGKNFFKMIAKRLNVIMKFTKDNNYKVACFYKNNKLVISVNSLDPIKQQKFYVAHMLGHLEMNWHYYPDARNTPKMSNKNIKIFKSRNNLVQVCGSLGFYNHGKNELYANYFAEKLLGYDLY